MELRTIARLATLLMMVPACAACGNREVGTEAGSGALIVDVNTPIARSGAVWIHGPAASSAHVTQTDTLRGLTAGEYLARAEDATPADSLVSPVLTGTLSDSSVQLANGETKTITGTYTIRGGSGALWVGKWGRANLAEGFTSPQLASAGTVAAADTLGDATIKQTIAGTAFDSAGNLWVTSYIDQEIYKFTPAQLASGESTPAVTISWAKEPWGIAFDARGNLWVGSYNGNYIVEYPAAEVSAWSGALTDPSFALKIATPNGPLGFAFDASGNLWVAGFDVAKTYEIAAAHLSGSGTIAPTDSLVSSYLDFGSGVAFDRGGNLWEATESGYIVGYSAAQLGGVSHGEPVFAQQGPGYAFDGLAFDNSGNLWVATEDVAVAMFSPAQRAGGDLSTPARTLTAASGERTFSLAFNTHDAELPIASTVVSASRASSAVRASYAIDAHCAPPPAVHWGDGIRPGGVVRP